MALIEVRDLSVTFASERGPVRAVDGVSFDIEEGQTLGMVGESGSGKSITNLALLGLVPSPPGHVTAERLAFRGRDLRELTGVRGKEIAMVFQDPLSALHPLLTIGRQLTEVLEVHEGLAPRAARQRSSSALGDVGIASPEQRLDLYPHELSGGMRQRVMIAMALLCKPSLLIADEPTTALDVTIAAEILELLARLQQQNGMAIVLVTHSLGVIAGHADRVLVMYAGRIVERGETHALFARPRHPYTQGLLSSVPSLHGDTSRPLNAIAGQPPDPTRVIAGCAFRERCGRAFDRCAVEAPALSRLADGAAVACHLDSARA